MAEIFEPKLDRNCGKCYWSTRDPTDLLISCQLGKQINNIWVTAHECELYNDLRETRKKTPNNQLDLFHNV